MRNFNIAQSFDLVFTFWTIILAIYQIYITEYVMSAITMFFSGAKVGYKIKELELYIKVYFAKLKEKEVLNNETQ